MFAAFSRKFHKIRFTTSNFQKNFVIGQLQKFHYEQFLKPDRWKNEISSFHFFVFWAENEILIHVLSQNRSLIGHFYVTIFAFSNNRLRFSRLFHESFIWVISRGFTSRLKKFQNSTLLFNQKTAMTLNRFCNLVIATSANLSTDF